MRETERCPWCDGEGWNWAGMTGGEAEKVFCEPCDGEGWIGETPKRKWLPWLGFSLAVFCFSLIVFSAMGYGDELFVRQKLWQYRVGDYWVMGPFTDLQSCESARGFQYHQGIHVGVCEEASMDVMQPIDMIRLL